VQSSQVGNDSQVGGAASSSADAKPTRVLFAPEDEYISIGSDTGGGDGGNVSIGDFEGDSDIDDERL